MKHLSFHFSTWSFHPVVFFTAGEIWQTGVQHKEVFNPKWVYVCFSCIVISLRIFEHFTKSRYPVSRCGNNNLGRPKRVVSCKRKTHHVTVFRRKQHKCGRNFDATHKETELKHLKDTPQDVFFMDSLELPLNVNQNSNTVSEQNDYYTLNEVTSTGHSARVALVWLYEKQFSNTSD